MLGSLAYRIPAVDKLFGLPMNYFDEYSSMSFYVKILINGESGPEQLECPGNIRSKCLIRFKRDVTPVVYTLQPPVVYYESMTELWFDPKYTTVLIDDLLSDEMPFINAKVGGSLMDFEFNVDDETTFSGY